MMIDADDKMEIGFAARLHDARLALADAENAVHACRSSVAMWERALAEHLEKKAAEANLDDMLVTP
jgi:hypothetical protein